jgi:hypothetical protein
VAINRRRHALTCIAASIAILSIFACGASAPNGDNGDRIPTRELEAILATTSPFQQAILEDGFLTFGEYEAAILATLQCLERRGLEPTSGFDAHGEPLSVPYWQEPYNTYFFMIRVPSDGDPSQRQECLGEYSGDVSRLWSILHPPDPGVLKAIWAHLAECMVSGGVDVADGVTHDEIQRAGTSTPSAETVYRACQRETESMFHFVQIWIEP